VVPRKPNDEYPAENLEQDAQQAALLKMFGMLMGAQSVGPTEGEALEGGSYGEVKSAARGGAAAVSVAGEKKLKVASMAEAASGQEKLHKELEATRMELAEAVEKLRSMEKQLEEAVAAASPAEPPTIVQVPSWC
jgi:hypothetical protein